jgi:hypothetical protein
MTEKSDDSKTSSSMPRTLAEARNADWSKITLTAPLTSTTVELLASSYGVKYYAQRSKEQLLTELLALDEQTVEASGMHRLPPNVLDAIEKSVALLERKEQRKEQQLKLSEESQERVVKQAFSLSSRVPRWFSLGGKESAIMVLDNGARFLIHQLDGPDGLFVYSQCPIGVPSLRSCAIPLTMAAMSKLVNVNVVEDNVVMSRLVFVRGLLSINLTKTNIANHMLEDSFKKFISVSKYFKDVDVFFVERTETDLQAFDSGQVSMKSNSLRRAGEAFMFNLVFGISDSPAAFKFKETARYVTKVVVDPAVNSIRKLLDLAKTSYANVVKSTAERSFLSTKTILDDAQFIEGMNEVHDRVLYNKSFILDTIDTSPLSPDDKQTLRDNIGMLSNTTLIDFLIRMSQMSDSSPWRPSK